MAGLDLAEDGDHLLAEPPDGEGATGMKGTSRGDAGWVGRLSRDDRPLAKPVGRVRLWNSFDKSLGVRVKRVC